MRPLHRLFLASLAVLLPMAVTNTACSVLGWGVGSALTRHDAPRVVPAGRALELHPGTRMGLRLADSTALLGTFVSRLRLEPVVYSARYANWRAQTGIALALGDMVEVSIHGDRTVRARFAGFAHRAILLHRADGNGFDEVRDSAVEWFGFGDSVGWTGEQLADADARGALPTREAILFRRAPASAGSDWYNTGQRMWSQAERHGPLSITVPCDDIDAIEIAGPRTARTVLLIAGLAADAMIVVAAGPTISANSSGCAYVSSSGSFALALGPVRPTALEFDTRWNAFRDGESPVPPAQDLTESFLPNLPMIPPAPMPSSAHRNRTTPTAAP